MRQLFTVIILSLLCISCAASEPAKQLQSVEKHTKVDPNLLTLLTEFENFLETNGSDDSFASKQSGIRTIADKVVLEAIAAADPQQLSEDLASLGAVKIAVSGRYVSCQFPILAIPDLELLDTLKFVRPVFSITWKP